MRIQYRLRTKTHDEIYKNYKKYLTKLISVELLFIIVTR